MMYREIQREGFASAQAVRAWRVEQEIGRWCHDFHKAPPRGLGTYLLSRDPVQHPALHPYHLAEPSPTRAPHHTWLRSSAHAANFF